MLRSGCSGASSGAIALVLEESWLTRPKNDSKSVRFLGVGN